LRVGVEALDQVAMSGIPSAIDGWESSLLERTRSPVQGTRKEVSTLADLGGMVDLLGQAARAIGGPTGSDPHYYFAPTADSSFIEERSEAVLEAVQALRERLRTALALVSAVSTSDALEVARETQASGEQFQRAVGIFGAVILGPTLVVGLFGANVSIPGEGKWWGFALMVGLMVASAIALLALLRHATKSAARSGDSR
jgi:Mg2+ and Co2+ transporter CorA